MKSTQYQLHIPSEAERVKCLFIAYSCGNTANRALNIKPYKFSSVKTSTFTSPRNSLLNKLHSSWVGHIQH